MHKPSNSPYPNESKSSYAKDPIVFSNSDMIYNPYLVYDKLRRQNPIYFCSDWNGWLVSRYKDISDCFRDSRLSSKRATAYVNKVSPELKERLCPLTQNLSHWSLFMDPPDHTRLRKLQNSAFTPRLIEALRPRIQAAVDKLLDSLGDKDEIDLVPEYAHRLPPMVIGELLGVPSTDYFRLQEWADTLAAFLGSGSLNPDLLEQALKTATDLKSYFLSEIDKKRIEPGNDLLSLLLQAQEKGTLLNEEELIGTCTVLLFGGTETTVHLIGNSVYTLLKNPSALQKLKQDPSILPAVVDELLRYVGSVKRMSRIAREDFMLRDQQIRAGDRIFMLIESGNRDPEYFLNPDCFDVDRKDNKHLAFGLGSHYCIGSFLGRLEVQLAIESLFARYPHLALYDPIHSEAQWIDNLTIRGLTALRLVKNQNSM